MKKHLRLYSVILTAFMLIGVMASVSLAADTVEKTPPKWKEAVDALGSDIGALIDAENKGFFSEAKVKEYSTAIEAESTMKSDAGTITYSVKYETKNKNAGTPKIFSTTSKKFGGSDVTAPKVDKDTEYTVTITAKDNGGSITKTFTFKVFAAPTITNDPAKEPKNPVVWGDTKAWSFELKGSNVDAWTINAAEKGDPKKGDLVTENFGASDAAKKSGLKFSEGKFEIDGDSWKPKTDEVLIFPTTWNGSDVKKTVSVYATRGKAANDVKGTVVETAALETGKQFTITYRGADPKFVKYDASKFEYTYNTEAKTGDAEKMIVIEGPGKITATATGLPTGLTLHEVTTTPDALKTDYPEKSPVAIYEIIGTPTVATKGTKVEITAENPYSKNVSKKAVKLSLNVVVKAEEVKITSDAEGKTAISEVTALKMNASSNKVRNIKVGAADATVNETFYAFPAPIKWSAKNLPAGLKLEPDKTDSTKATLKGKISSPTKDITDDEKNTYTITAANADFPTVTKELTGKVIVWAAPTFKQKNDKPITVKTGENGIKFSISTNNPVDPAKWDVKIGVGTNKTSLVTTGNAVDAGWAMDNNAAELEGSTKIKADVSDIAKNTVSFGGEFDRVLKSGAKLELDVTVSTPTGASGADDPVKQTYTINVTGVAPKFGKGDFTFDQTNVGPENFELAAGTLPVVWTAEIDAKTVAKITGVKKAEAITLTSGTKDTTTGLTFTALTGANSSKATFAWDKSTKVAFKKLPITVKAYNENINKEKPTTGKVTVTVEGTDPGWQLSTYEAKTGEITPSDSDTTYAKEKDIVENYDSKIDLNVGTSKALNIAFKTTGDGPLAVTVKPDKKNGITAEYKDGVVTFSGTPEAPKKDTATKFTLEAKNNSTGKSSKVAVNFTALPTPTLVDGGTTITPKPVIYGKNVKVAPKLAVTNKDVKWVITSIKPGTASATYTQAAADLKTETEIESAVDAANTALEAYGLAFDSKKGVISGKTTYATGNADTDALVIKMVPKGVMADGAEVTATIKVLGEKVKLTTKSIALTTDTTDTETMAPDKLVAETNLKDVTEKNRANITWTVKKYPTEMGNYVLTADPTGKTDGTANGIKANLAGTKDLKVTKKAQVDITFNNYGTESTGKLNVTIGGPQPTLTDKSGTTVKYGKSGGYKAIAPENADLLSSNLKWKIASKTLPKGVSATIKGNAKGTADLTFKVGPKVTDGEASVTVTVTDSVTKKTSEAATYSIAIDPYQEPEDSSAEAPLVADKPEAVTDTKEDVTSDKTLGEGTVKLGSARTAEGLTSAQRAAIEDKGYVIAAVLPEVEVEDASGAYVLEVGELDEAAATGAELVYFAFASKPTTDDEYAIFANAEDGAETTVIPENRKVTVEAWLNVGTKYAPVIAVKANAAAAEAKTEEDVKAKAEEKAEEAKEESKEDSAKTETKEVKE